MIAVHASQQFGLLLHLPDWFTARGAFGALDPQPYGSMMNKKPTTNGSQRLLLPVTWSFEKG